MVCFAFMYDCDDRILVSLQLIWNRIVKCVYAPYIPLRQFPLIVTDINFVIKAEFS